MGASFYTQSWALFRYLRTAAPKDVTDRVRRWEALCKGAALGAEAGKPRGDDVSPASAAFQKEFGADLPAIEAGFKAWLAAQVTLAAGGPGIASASRAATAPAPRVSQRARRGRRPRRDRRDGRLDRRQASRRASRCRLTRASIAAGARLRRAASARG
jgi:hypothetical protein